MGWRAIILTVKKQIMKTEIEIKSHGNKVLFSHEFENNTVLRTLEQALRERANLSGANLSGANLSGANLSGANLSMTDLSGANLSGANLRSANLSGANLSMTDLSMTDLSGVNLRSADLSMSDLSGANLRNANLSMTDLSGANLRNSNLRNANLPLYCRWSVTLKDDKIQIGCELKTIPEWDKFFESDKTITTQRGTEEFKRIQASYEAYKAYYLFMQS
jgi:hypothetical protein